MPQPFTATSLPFADPVSHEASLTMTYGDAVISVTFKDDIVSLPEREEVETTLDGLRHFVAESQHWTSVVDRRISPRRDKRYLGHPTDFPLSVSYSWVGEVRRVEAASLDTAVYSVAGDVSSVGLTYDRNGDRVTFAARGPSRLLWVDWNRFLSLHEEFLNVCTTGERNGYEFG